ncbi:MAG: RNA polymerase sigma factor [Gemmataceae bacterium]
MSKESLRTIHLRDWLDRMRAGEESAREELLASVCKQLEHLTRKMLRRYPDVQRYEQTGDVLNKALLRLLRALEEIDPYSVRDFYSLAAVQIRRELLDMAKHYRGVYGLAKNHDSIGKWKRGDEAHPQFDPPDTSVDPVDLERWTLFHQAVENLPAQEREIVSLVFYHRWTHPEIADLFQVSERTIGRWWASACLKLDEELNGELPDLTE